MLPNGWKKSKIGETCSLLSGQDFPPNLYGNEEKGLPYITGASNFAGNHIILNRWTEHPKNIAKKGDILLVCKGSGFGITAIADFEKAHIARQVMALQKLNGVDKDFLYQVISMNVRNIKQKGCGLIPGIDRKTVLNIEYLLPPIEEQKKIAATLSVWDSAIEKMEKLIEALEERYQSYVNEFFFENQNDKRKLKMGDVFAVRNDRSIATENMPLYSLTIENGITAKTDRYDRGALVKDKDSKKYKIVCDGDIVYNPANLRWGAIGQSKVGHNVVVSPIYEVLYARDNCNNSRYLSHYIMSKKMIAFYSSKTEGTLIERKEVKIDQFLRIDLYIEKDPVMQKKIADVLDMHQEEISNLKQQLENYKKQKQGLMQKLLTGQWRVK